MAIFKLTALDGSVGMLVRARCLSCARQVATANAGDEGTAVWARRERSTVELVRDPVGHAPEGSAVMLERL